MNNIPLIDISGVNCWIVYLLPFSEKNDWDAINAFQKQCIKDKVFGMGWNVEVNDLEFGEFISEENVKKYVETYNSKESDRAYIKTLNCFKEVKKGDYVITRLKNSHYYIGKVSSERAKYIYKKDDTTYSCFSWGGYVEEWVEYQNETDIPSEIIGRFSQRRHPTIQRISGYRQCLLVLSMYEKKTKEKIYNIPPLHIDNNNFVRCMNYMDLEDLVALYIYKKHNNDGYILFPSSCKINKPKFEFYFETQNKRPISCQVKNQEEISISEYKNEDSFEIIYIFSGIWSDEEVNQKNNDASKPSNVIVISPSELYKTIENDLMINSDYYAKNNKAPKTDKIISKMTDDFSKHNKGCKWKENNYEKTEDFISFFGNDFLFYSYEFGALIHKEHKLYHFKTIENEKAYIDKIYKMINA